MILIHEVLPYCNLTQLAKPTNRLDRLTDSQSPNLLRLLTKYDYLTDTVASLATLLVPSLVHIPVHNISPSLGKQLVLELERGMSHSEAVHRLPGRLRRGQASPLHQDVPGATLQPGTKHTLGLEQRAPMLKWGQRWCRRRRCADEGLEDADVEHIMNASTGGQLQPVRHLANAFQNLKRTSKLGPKLLASSRL